MLCRRLIVGARHSWALLAEGGAPAVAVASLNASAALTSWAAAGAACSSDASYADTRTTRTSQRCCNSAQPELQRQLPSGARPFHAARDTAAMRRPRGIGEGGVEDEALEKSVELIRQMPRKQQESALNQILKGRSTLPGFTEQAAAPEGRLFDMHVVDVNRTVKVTKGGSLQRFSALVVVGNGNGVVGWAMGKAPEVGVAVEKAYAKASRSLFFFERFENHTIYHNTSAKYGRSIVHMAPLPSGSGVKANQTIQAVCRLAGIKDLRAKVHGSHNPHTTLRAVFEALDAVRSPEEIGLATGRTVVRL